MDRETAETYSLALLGAAEGVFKYYIRPEITAKRTWLAIGAIVALHEIFCPEGELLSEGADRAIEKHPVLIPLATIAIAGHVANLIDERYDLIHRGVKFIKG